MQREFSRIFILLFVGVSFLISCSDDDDNQSIEPSEESLINDWVYDVMDEVYFWTDQMPIRDNVNFDENPSVFFESLLFSGDRFSVIVADYEELLNSLNGIELEAGYEFILAGTQDSDEVVAIITYVKNNSPAQNAGLQRGDLISHVNGQLMTQSNFSSVINEVFSDHSVSYRRFNESNGSFEDQPEVSLSVVQISENPIFLDSVYTVGSNKIGYLVYNFFSDGDGSGFDNQVREIFGKFKSQNITDLVLDLRYNSGGSVNSATNLASHIAPGVTSNDVFYLNQWNDLLQSFLESEPDGDTQLTGYFNDVVNNVGNDISSNLYILTSNQTASASELMINGLDAYMNVTIIGESTTGKNVGSIAIDDDENPDNDYGLLPIVFQIANKDGFADYADGFTPLGENRINEFQLLPLEPFGDVEDPLLSRAIELITGSPDSGRKSNQEVQNIIELGSSFERHLRSNKMIIEGELPSSIR